VDTDLQHAIIQVLDEAKAASWDHVTETEKAVRAVLQARPAMTAPSALAAVNLFR
jgi:hypothetical protein